MQFVDADNDDFHLAAGDTGAKNAGTSLAADANLAFTTDIEGTFRGGAWDIGADEVPVEFVSLVCEGIGAGGDCADLDPRLV